MSGYKQFWGTQILDKCQGAFVCEYDQNYEIKIVTQQKNRILQSVSLERLFVHFTFKYTKPFLSESKQFWRNTFLDKAETEGETQNKAEAKAEAEVETEAEADKNDF